MIYIQASYLIYFLSLIALAFGLFLSRRLVVKDIAQLDAQLDK